MQVQGRGCCSGQRGCGLLGGNSSGECGVRAWWCERIVQLKCDGCSGTIASWVRREDIMLHFHDVSDLESSKIGARNCFIMINGRSAVKTHQIRRIRHHQSKAKDNEK